jgi:hypothetical protein
MLYIYIYIYICIIVVLFVDHNRSTIGLLRPTILKGTLLEVALHLFVWIVLARLWYYNKGF